MKCQYCRTELYDTDPAPLCDICAYNEAEHRQEMDRLNQWMARQITRAHEQIRKAQDMSTPTERRADAIADIAQALKDHETYGPYYDAQELQDIAKLQQRLQAAEPAVNHREEAAKYKALADTVFYHYREEAREAYEREIAAAEAQEQAATPPAPKVQVTKDGPAYLLPGVEPAPAKRGDNATQTALF